jgi:hypothetical protein
VYLEGNIKVKNRERTVPVRSTTGGAKVFTAIGRIPEEKWE